MTGVQTCALPICALFARRFLALRQQFAARGLRLVILKGCRRTGSYLLYLYRERDLAEVLGRREHRDFLRAMGYTPWEADPSVYLQFGVVRASSMASEMAVPKEP